jgi:hypothetical protein
MRWWIVLAAASTVIGCGPDYNGIANRLRKENLDQRSQISTLNEKLTNRDVTIHDLQARLGVGATQPTAALLAPEYLSQVFTATRIEIRSQTDAEDLGGGNWGLRVFLRFFDDDGQIIPATGTLTIETFELPVAPAEPHRLGTWTVTPEEMKKDWYTGLGQNHFAISCPLETVPTGVDVVIRVKLRDALTGHVLAAEMGKKLTAAPAK